MQYTKNIDIHISKDKLQIFENVSAISTLFFLLYIHSGSLYPLVP